MFLCAPRPLRLESLLIALIPVAVAVTFFIIFLRLLKMIESHAHKRKDILLSSRIIWEFNKSWIIRCTIGKIKSFIEEKRD